MKESRLDPDLRVEIAKAKCATCGEPAEGSLYACRRHRSRFRPETICGACGAGSSDHREDEYGRWCR